MTNGYCVKTKEQSVPWVAVDGPDMLNLGAIVSISSKFVAGLEPHKP